MTKQERASEPIHVSKLSIALGALGFGLLSLAQSVFAWAPTGTRFEWALMVLGSLSLAGAMLHHVDHHVRRFGALAVVLINVSLVGAAFVYLPYALNLSLRGTEAGIRYTYSTWGVVWLIGSAAVFAVLARKEIRLEHDDKTSETEIHASFFQLTTLAVGMLIYGIGFLLLGDPVARDSRMVGALSVVGPLLIALAVIAHIEHLMLRMGKVAVVLTAVGVSLWGIKNLFRPLTGWFDNEALNDFFVFGLQGVFYAMGALACVFVLFHKQAWAKTQGQ